VAAARAGKFELAHDGTVLLDEIADMEPATQTKIPRASESGTAERLGSSRSMPAETRLVSATNKDILALVREKPLPRGPVLSAGRRDAVYSTLARAYRRHSFVGWLF
jgi:transcriptional regulator with PAS, ATPase and Fis domain